MPPTTALHVAEAAAAVSTKGCPCVDLIAVIHTVVRVSSTVVAVHVHDFSGRALVHIRGCTATALRSICQGGKTKYKSIMLDTYTTLYRLPSFSI